MRSIIHRSVFFYITHLLTFSIMPLSTAFAGRKWGVVFHSLLGFVWLPSSVLWSEWGESYSFLRLLPVRDRDVVRAKLGLGLGAVAAYWALLSLAALAAWGPSPEFLSRFSLITLIASVWPPLVALCYTGIWRNGVRAMLFPWITLMGFFMVVYIGFVSRFARLHRDDVLLPLAGGGWPLSLLAVVVGLIIFSFLAGRAARVKWNSDDHLQIP